MPRGQGKKTIASVMKKWKAGSLKSSSGGKVGSQKQAIAIALSEAKPKGK